jgi:hypothetical protein
VAAESCPVFPGDPQRIHSSFEDPAAIHDATGQRRAFERYSLADKTAFRFTRRRALD